MNSSFSFSGFGVMQSHHERPVGGVLRGSKDGS